MSLFVISLVVWLVLVFLSVTTGIEKKWVAKLTTLNAPIRITPTQEYFSSYYYRIDGVASSSNFSLKNISQKLSSINTDPYQIDVDMELPQYWPIPLKDNNNHLLDPVKKVFNILEDKKKSITELAYQDYEISSALMKLYLYRNDYNNTSSSISQMSYLISYDESNPYLHDRLVCEINKHDINHILSVADNFSNKSTNSFHFEKYVLDKINIKNIRLKQKRLPLHLVKADASFTAFANKDAFGNILSIVITESSGFIDKNIASGTFLTQNNQPYFLPTNANEKTLLSQNCNIYLDKDIDVTTSVLANDNNIKLSYNTTIQGNAVEGNVSLDEVVITSSEIKEDIDLFSYVTNNIENYYPIILPLSYKDNGVKIGDNGYLSYSSSGISSTQEQRLKTIVTGYYDPGILPVGCRFLLVSPSVTTMINSVASTLSPDGTATNGINLWIKNINKVDEVKLSIENALVQNNIDAFWKVATYKEYDFSKDLMQQFQSDRTLFTLIAIIILVVACSNIISLLILLVNDKKAEIAVLQAMGSSRKSIATIFGMCGVTMGIVSTCIGTIAAIITLKNINVLVSFLSAIQGHNAFNPAFFGQTLPNELSPQALIFILIATPIISLAAGIIPAIIACRLNPSKILRAE
jgi:lipoprotein-releasing system permease protein